MTDIFHNGYAIAADYDFVYGEHIDCQIEFGTNTTCHTCFISYRADFELAQEYVDYANDNGAWSNDPTLYMLNVERFTRTSEDD